MLLGGAALTRAYVEQDLDAVYDGEVRYARDAFEGLPLMERVVAMRRGEPGAALPEPRRRRVRATQSVNDGDSPHRSESGRSDVARGPAWTCPHRRSGAPGS